MSSPKLDARLGGCVFKAALKYLQGLLLLLSFAACLPLGAAKGSEPYVRAGNQAYDDQRYAEAITAYQHAIKLDSGDAAAFQGLGNCFLAQGDKDRALVYYRFALQIAPANKALQKYVDKLTGSPQALSPTAGGESAKFLRYGRYYADRNQPGYALYYYKKSLEADPSNEEAKSLMQGLAANPLPESATAAAQSSGTASAMTGPRPSQGHPALWGGIALAAAAVLTILFF
jgi:tetratricopeptide (TPR) repeat protein